MAEQFLSYGDRVVISGRNPVTVQKVVEELRATLKQNDSSVDPSALVFGQACDVRDPESVETLAVKAAEQLQHVDIWVNNAGVTHRTKAPIDEVKVEEIQGVVETNLFGTVYGCRAAIRSMKAEGKNTGTIFNVDGFGSRGNPSPGNVGYGLSKAAIPQLTKSLSKETKDTKIGVHVVSPGMVITDLLLTGNREKRSLKVFNILAEKPETAAEWLVPRMRGVADKPRPGSRYISYLTVPGVVWRFFTAPWRRNRLIKVD
eukprot:CAMPEP_0170179304 /NCGR_PEP_ID=MMETSP0040_2-20121228/17246_1 /TAXON_ID=641309 /ORGANISM="Lotharella oceanica, Strain CCMP622" /LENGTH=258 /DNA_ID=CAMNT_0010423311 /DNA_START=108 /DNA_END=884 /DNA_ORIENTATION=+